MKMFSIDIMSNLKYKKPSKWLIAKYKGSRVRIDGLNPDSLSSEINGIEPEKLTGSLYAVCTNGKTPYKLVMEYLESADTIPTLVKESTKIYSFNQIAKILVMKKKASGIILCS